MKFVSPGKLHFRLTNINLREEKHGPESVLGMDLKFKAILSNTFMDQVDPELRPSRYKVDPDNASADMLDGEYPLTKLRVTTIKETIAIDKAHTLTGYRIVIPFGGNPESAIVYDDRTKIHGIKFTPEEGGIVVTEFTVSVLPAPEELSKVVTMLGSEMPLVLEEPSAKPAPQAGLDFDTSDKPANPFPEDIEAPGAGWGDLDDPERVAAIAAAVEPRQDGGGDPIVDAFDSPAATE